MKFLAKGNKWQFDITKDNQEKYISSLGEAKNDFERSYKQYKCQMLFVGRQKKIAFNFVFLLLIPFYIILAFCRRLTTKKKKHIAAIIEPNTHSGVIPKSLYDQYPAPDPKPWSGGWSFGVSDLGYISKLLPYIIHSPYFVFKNLYKGGMYSKMIKEYTPKAIIVFNEYSFTSSALTSLCESKNVEHIDVMHGEKLFFIRDSFFRFTRTYVWDSYYVELFKKLKASQEQFIVETPPFMSINSPMYMDKNLYSDFTYYLANFNEDEIKNIIKSMEFAVSKGKKVKYRPHPRYSNINLLKKYVDENSIEYPSSVNILSSVANTNCAVGVYTTVLNQAYHSGKKVVIDDLNFPHIFEKLSELDYVLLSKPIDHLSNYQK